MAEEKKINYVVYDLETGGFDSEKVAITEIAMIAIDGQSLEEIERYTTFIKPYADLGYDQQALKATGITMDMIHSGKDAKVVATEVNDFLKRQGTAMNKKPILCGHNIVKFDNPFLRKLLGLYRKDLDKIINKDMFMDTMWFSRMRMPYDQDDFGKHSLGVACSREGIEVIDAHRAMNDTAANARLVVSYLKHLRGKGENVVKQEKHSYRETFKF
jgi:DNA polymerase III alpha subunit (gram-positive type)